MFRYKLIKCSYITKKVFSLLDIKKTLNIINHNKKLLQKLDYNVDTYKNLAEREIIISKKGKEEMVKNILLIQRFYYLKENI